MRIGGSLIVIALGAILKFAVTKHFSGVDIQTVGVILMIVGLAWLVFELIWWGTRRRTDVIQHGNGVTYVTPNDPVERM